MRSAKDTVFCGWCYWINNILYYPNLLISTAVIALYAIGKGDSPLKDDWRYVLPATLLCLWVAVALNIVGVATGKWLQNAGGLGTYLSGLLIVLLGLYGMATIPPPDSTNPSLFRLKVIGGALGFIVIGGVIYVTARMRAARGK